MKQKTLALWLKLILIGVALCGAVICALILPGLGTSLVESAPEFGHCYWPWLIFLWICALPCFAALVVGWRIADNIGKDRSFTNENAKLLSVIAILAGAAAALLFTGNIVFMFLNMNHPGIMLASLLVVFVVACFSVGMAALSHLVRKAAALQEESDLTI